MKPRGGGKRFGGGGKPGGFRKGPGRGGKPGGFRKGPGGGGKRFSGGSDRGGGESRGGSYGDRAGGADRGGFRSERPPGAKRFSGGADRGGFRSERPPGAKRFSGGPDRAGPDRGGGESRGGFRSERPGGGKRFSGGGERGGGESRGGFRSERPPGAKRFSGGPDRGGGESRGGYRGGGESRGGFRSERPGGGFRGPKPSFKRERSFDPAPGAEAPAAEGEAFVPKSTTRFVFGVNPALEALRARSEEIERLYYAEGSMNPSVAGEILSRARDAGVRVDQVPRERLTAMADGGVHQGLVLEMREFKYAELDELTKDPGLVVVLDSLQDPQNVGAIIRSANAFGAKGVVLAKDRAAAITGSVAKASAGATEHTKIVRVTNLSRALEELKAAGYWTVAADPEGETLGERKLDGPLVVVIGAEGPGVRQGVLAQCDFKVRIPMLGQVASLNASVSAGILLYEIVRQRAARPAAAAPAK